MGSHRIMSTRGGLPLIPDRDTTTYDRPITGAATIRHRHAWPLPYVSAVPRHHYLTDAPSVPLAYLILEAMLRASLLADPMRASTRSERERASIVATSAASTCKVDRLVGARSCQVEGRATDGGRCGRLRDQIPSQRRASGRASTAGGRRWRSRGATPR